MSINNNNNNSISTNEVVEGQLSKFTNSFKGYQHRYFVLDPSRGTLEYYINQEEKQNPPKGFIILSGSIITPSEEDGQKFNVCSSSGQIYKLRASDSKERQFWVDKLRQASQKPPETSRTSCNLEISAVSSLEAVRDMVLHAQNDLQQLEAAIDNHPVGDHTLYTTKALAQASVCSMKQCYSLLNTAYKT